MSRRRSPSRRAAARLGRPKGRARLVEVQASAYEVLDLPDGGRKVFAIELRYVEPGSPEFELVARTIETQEADARAQTRYREAVAAWKPGEPRPVRPHRSGGGLP